MICKKCGAKNSDTRVKCFHCGAIFDNTNIDGAPVKSAPAIQEFTVESVTEEDIEETSFVVEEQQKELIENDIIEEDSFVEEIVDDVVEETQDEEFLEDEFIEDEFLEDESEDEYENIKAPKEKSSAKSDKNRSFNIAIWLLSLVFIIGLILVGTLIYQYISDNNSEYIGPSGNTVEKLNLPKPEITKLKDGKNNEYIHAVFKGTPGDRLHLKCNNSYHTFITETLEIDLYLEDLFNNEYEFHDATVNANLNAYYLRDNKEYSYEAGSVQMTVPEAEIDTSKLSSQNIKAYSDKYYIEFWTSTDAHVELNNKNITSTMDGTGNFKYEINVEPDSKTTYSLSVTQPYRIPKNIVFVISRDPLPVTLTIASNNSESISDKTITLKCQTEEGAEVSASLPIINSVKNELYNTYEITLSLENCEYGEIEVLISATSNKGTSTKTHTFMYWPDEKTVTTSSSKFTTAVATNPTNYKNRNYVLNSVKVTKNIGSNKFEGIINISGVDYTIVLDKTDVKANVVIGNSYKIFAACTGEKEGNSPVMRAWFIYNA